MKWELMYTEDWNEARRLAGIGWEMCGASQSGFMFGTFGFLGGTTYYFKREI